MAHTHPSFGCFVCVMVSCVPVCACLPGIFWTRGGETPSFFFFVLISVDFSMMLEMQCNGHTRQKEGKG